MTNTPSPTDEDRELKYWGPDVDGDWIVDVLGTDLAFAVADEEKARRIADRLESLLSDRAKLEEVTPEMLWAGRQQAVLQCIRIEDFQMERIYVAMLKDALNRSTDRAT